MHVSSPTRLVAQCREEKEASLISFMSEVIERARESAGETQLQWSVLARNLESPCARAIAKIAADQTSSLLAIRAIVLDAETPALSHAGPSLPDIDIAELRILKDARFTAAHEQLVLGETRVWIGDCMRRDPVKRDAFQLFHGDEPFAARHARTSFERLWIKAGPAKTVLNTLVPGLVAARETAAKPSARPASRR